MSHYGFTGRRGKKCYPPSDYIKISRLKTDLQIRPGLLGHGELRSLLARELGASRLRARRSLQGSSEFGLRQEKAILRSCCFGVRVRRPRPGLPGRLLEALESCWAEPQLPCPTPPLTLLKHLATLSLYGKTLSAVFGVWFCFVSWPFLFFFPSLIFFFF